MASGQPWLKLVEAAGGCRIELGGLWIVDNSFSLKNLVANIPDISKGKIQIDAAAVDALDSMGTWFIYKIVKPLAEHKLSYTFTGISKDQAVLLKRM